MITKKTSAKVSVIIPTYNRAAFLPVAVKSVLAQTHRNFEMIIIDDGSTDGTEETVKKFQDKDGRIKYFYQENRGVSAACNLGIRKASGDFFAFLDSDDEWFPEKTEKQLALFSANPGLGFVGCNKLVEVIDSSGRVVKKLDLYGRKFPGGIRRFTPEDFLSFNSPVNPTCVMIAREALLKTGFFDEDFNYAEDSDFWIRLSLNYPFETLWEPLARYRRWPEATSSTIGFLEKVEVKKQFFLKHKSLYGRYPRARSKVFRSIGYEYMIGGRRKDALFYTLLALRADPGFLVDYLNVFSEDFWRRGYRFILRMRK